MRVRHAVALLAVAACVGEGSDVGPRIEPLPPDSYRVLVKDADGRGVSSARVAMPDVPGATGVTIRSGAADLFVAPAGTQLVQVDASLASAVDGDRLGSLAFRTDIDPAGQLAFVIHVPDLAGSAALDLPAGTLPGPATLDDGAWSGARVEFAAGAVVGAGGAGRAVVRTGALRADRIPPLQLGGGQPTLVSRGVLVEPADLSVVPAAALTLPNDLGLAAGASADLFRLDPADGVWRRVAAAVASPDGTALRAAEAVAGGGLYAAVAAAPGAAARLIGRVVREDTEDPLAGLRVRAAQVVAVTDGGGRFVLEGVPATDAAGTATGIALVLAGGGPQLPLVEEVAVAAAPGAEVDLGDLESGIAYGTDLRLQLIRRGQALVGRRFGVGQTATGAGAITPSGPEGRVDFPLLEEGVVGFLSESPDPRVASDVRVAQGLLFLSRGRSQSLQIFYGQEPWGLGGEPLVWALDPATGGPIGGVDVFRNRGGGDEFIGTTRFDQIDRFDVRSPEVVVTLGTTFDGVDVRSAFAVQNFDIGRLEAPLPRASRARIGAFDRHGRVTGEVQGAGPMRTVLAQGVTDEDAWFDAVLAGRSLAAAAPVIAEPSRDGGTGFELGVPSTGGTVVATSTEIAGGSLNLRDVAFAGGLAVAPATRTAIDLSPPVAADAEFVVTGAFVGLDPRLTAARFTFDLGVRLPDGSVLDVVRGVRGDNLSVRGDDAALRLPPLAGPLAGARHGVVLYADVVTGVFAQPTRIVQRSYLRLDRTPVAAAPLLAVPQVSEPTPGATVPASGFDVRFTLPPEAVLAEVTLRSAPGEPLRTWTTVVPSSSTSCRFRAMPRGAEVLEPGNYTLEVTAYAYDFGGVLRAFDSPYLAIVTRWFGIRPATLGVRSVSTLAFDVVLGP